jgi:hypothetical protein
MCRGVVSLTVMNETEFAELLRFIQARMREYGFAEINERIIAEIRIDPGSSSSELLRYLRILTSELRVRTDEPAQRIIESFREIVQTDSGRPVDGLTVLLSDQDSQLFGTATVNLSPTRDISVLLADLERLQSELRDSRE